MMEPMHELLQEAKKGGYGIPAPNVYNRFTIEAALQAADELNAPVILGCPGVFGIEEVGELARYYERKYPRVPFAVNLDHGGPFEHLIRAIRAGFSSVMVDRSTLPYEQNVAETKEIVKIAHNKGISVEAEVGGIGGVEDGVASNGELADPEQCKAIADLGVDFLACGIGNIHGLYPANWAGLSFDRLSEIKALTGDLPLVLHGGTGIPVEQVQKAISLGVSKINVNTDLQVVFAEATRKYIESGADQQGKGYDPRKLLKPGREAIVTRTKELICEFGSDGKAWN